MMITILQCSVRLDFSFKQQFKKYRDLIDFKNGQKHDEQRIQEIDCKISIYESMFLKIFLFKNFLLTPQRLAIQYNNQILIQQKEQLRNKVKPLIRKLNKIQNKYQSENELNKEINLLLKELVKPFCIFSYPDFYGLTCLDGTFIFQRQIVNYKDQKGNANIYHALFIITCIHEVFFHLKRVKFCHMYNVLLTTPPKYSAGENESENQGEAGQFFEYRVFKNTIEIDNCSQELAVAILDPKNWEDDNFTFSDLVKRNDSPNKNQQKDSSLMKQSYQVMSPPPRETRQFKKCLSGFSLGRRIAPRVTKAAQ